MKQILLLAAAAALAPTLGCHGGRPERPTPEAKRAMDSAMTAVHDSGGADTTARDSTRP